MNRKWQTEIRELINSSDRELNKLQAQQEAQHQEKILKISELKAVLIPKLEFVRSVIHKETEFGQELLEKGLPKIVETAYEIEFIMPGLSEVNKMDMQYRIEFNNDNGVILCAYDKCSTGKMELAGKVESDFESFIECNITRFLMSWYKRKTGDELAKERVLQLKITSKAMK